MMWLMQDGALARTLAPGVLAALVLAGEAQAGWRYTAWGMTPAQAIAASDGEIRRDASLLDAGPDRQTLAGRATVVGAAADVTLGFAGGKLADVTLVPEDAAACPAFKAQLLAARGAPRRTVTGAEIVTYHWLDDVSAADIALSELGGDDIGCRVVYSPASVGRVSGF
jgi:hypothetical protein